MAKTADKRGFTLVEVMITAVASAIVILTVGAVLFATFQSWRINNVYADMRRDASLAIFLMSRDVRESDMTNVTTATAGRLTLSANPPARDSAVTYLKSGSALNSTDFGTIIRSGVHTFRADRSSSDDGVYLTLGMTNSVFGNAITLTNRVFVNTRN